MRTTNWTRQSLHPQIEVRAESHLLVAIICSSFTARLQHNFVSAVTNVDAKT